ncbi:MAG: cache domain-containing protein [Desulfobacter sp.]|nr:cache domain-containing protein [Desulfobacter sp.]
MAAVNQAVAVFEAMDDGAYTDFTEQKEAAIAIIDKMRWGTDGKGYFWIQDTDGLMVHHPIKPALNKKNLLGMKDPDGKLFFKEMDRVAKEQTAGFVDYKWPKPGFEKPQDKISYVKLYKPWNWIIGTGVYLESTEEQAQANALRSIGSIRYGEKGAGYFSSMIPRASVSFCRQNPSARGKIFGIFRTPKAII